MSDVKHTSAAGVELSLRIGQRVRHRDHQGKRVTGVVRGMSIEDERGLVVTVLLDEPIVIQPISKGDREIRIYWQNVDANELSPFDDKDELIAEMLEMLRQARTGLEVANERIEFGKLLGDIDATIAKATGGASHG